jgi:hypothetical protein
MSGFGWIAKHKFHGSILAPIPTKEQKYDQFQKPTLIPKL